MPMLGLGKKKEKAVTVYETIEEAEAAEAAEASETTETAAAAGENDEAWTQAGYVDADKVIKESETTAPIDPMSEADASASGAKAIKKIAPKIKKLPLKTLYTIAGIMAVLILIFAVITIILSRPAKPVYPAGTAVLVLPDTQKTDGGYIYIDVPFSIDGSVAQLLGVMPDSQATVLYFSRYFDLKDCMDFSLKDSDGNVCYLDLSRHMDGGMTNKLYFQPLNEGIEYFELLMPDYVMSEYEHSFFYFDKALEYPAALFAANQSASLSFEGNNATLSINEAAFSPAGTFVTYSLMPDSDNIKIIPESRSFMTLYGSKSLIPPLDGFGLQESVDNANILGEAGFWRIDGFNNTPSITMNGLLCEIKINKTVQVDSLFLNDSAHAIQLKLANYTLVLERMKGKGDTHVLVLHTIDTTLPVPDNPNDYSNRVYASYALELVLGKDSDGNEIILTPSEKSYKSAIGSDYVFIGDSSNKLDYSPENISLRIISGEIKMEPVSFDINRESLSETRDEKAKAAIDYIISQYKNDNADKDAYTVQAVSWHIAGDEITVLLYDAGVDNGKTFRAKHTVKGLITNGGFNPLLKD